MSENIQETNNIIEEKKKCKHCQSDIPKKAKICPVCKKKQSSKLKWGIIIIVILLFIGGLSGEDESETVNKVETSQETNEDFNNVEEITVSQDKKETVFKVGETAEYKDVQISLLGYEESEGNDWGNPESGNIFVYAEIEIVNNSDEEISISSMMSFENYCDDYKLDYSSNALMALSTEENANQLDGSIAPGKKMKGVLGLEVPSNWNNIEIYYKDNSWLDSNFSFIIEK